MRPQPSARTSASSVSLCGGACAFCSDANPWHLRSCPLITSLAAIPKTFLPEPVNHLSVESMSLTDSDHCLTSEVWPIRLARDVRV